MIKFSNLTVCIVVVIMMTILSCIVFENMIFRNLTIRIVIDDPPVKNTMRSTELQGIWIFHMYIYIYTEHKHYLHRFVSQNIYDV